MRETKVTEGMLETLMAEAKSRIPSLQKEITSGQGRRKGLLRTSKPTKGDGLTKYVWRMVRFHTGADYTLPVVCEFDLHDWVRAHGDEWPYCGGPFNDLCKRLDAEVIDPIILNMGMNPYKAALRWGRALGYLPGEAL